MNRPLRILVIGAHPDDCELKAGGICALYRQAGHEVTFVSVSCGNAGHHRMKPRELAEMRKAEAEAVARLMGIRYIIMGQNDGEILPTLELRQKMIALIRREQPDLVLTHRPNDYHPDHRGTSQVVADAAYLLIVPNIVPEAPALRENPVIMYLSDNFQKPTPFEPAVVVDVTPVFESILDQLACHACQFGQWLPYTMLKPEVEGAAAIRQAAQDFYEGFNGPLASRFHKEIEATYGPVKAQQVRFIEAFEPCEYGAPLTAEAKKRLFPFLP
ncbi:4-oxalmesaconate hydratase [Planctopirus ephydatiae]|uniref:4-oxalmesaconate hydratase n=1 Tax=Planctopirus ephydatiae TaxID=2528019 RepID=A0A518GMX0_9PLAN|nr:PIG-L deacetylase family protein [Planctopirus ephydatiae]QDV29879.1 4-oxalmesaconate hydratase [Planctopirus ephydatiae]